MDIYLHKPVVDNNKLILSWDPSFCFLSNTYWIECPDLEKIDCPKEKLSEVYFPVCLALAALGTVRFHLPYRVRQDVLDNWMRAIKEVAAVRYVRPCQVEFVNGEEDEPYEVCDDSYSENALLLGGGSESLLTLATLLDEGVRPYLISLGGPLWAGSDPTINTVKFKKDMEIARETGLQVINIRSNFKEIVSDKTWRPLMKSGASILVAVLYCPFFVSLVYPVCHQFRIGRIFCGGEKECINAFAEWAETLYASVSRGVLFESRLSELPKYDVVATLHLKYPSLARHQNSCHFRTEKRWCCRCEKCYRNYFIFKNNGLDLSVLELDEQEIIKNERLLIKLTVQEMLQSGLKEWMHLFSLIQEPYLLRLKRKILICYHLTALKDELSLFVRKFAPGLYRLYRKSKDIFIHNQD